MAPASIMLNEGQPVDEMQAELPVTLLYLPATHWTHGPPPGPVVPLAQGSGSGWQTNGSVPTFSYPELHVHAVTALLAVGDVLNAVHSVHTELPGRLEYVPAKQF
jgi:hypothetical protein